MPQSEIVTLAHWEGKKIKIILIILIKHRAAGQIHRQANEKRPVAPNGQSAPGATDYSEIRLKVFTSCYMKGRSFLIKMNCSDRRVSLVMD